MRIVPLWISALVFFFQSAPSNPVVATKDPQAVGIVNQTLATAGGMKVITTLEDYTASGTVTYLEPDSVSGSVTIRQRDLSQLRIDSNLPTGTRSQLIDGGQITVREGDLSTTLFEQGPIYPGCIVLPNLFLAVASTGSDFALTYKGTVTIDGRAVHHVQTQRALTSTVTLKHPEVLTADFFIDAVTFQVVMMKSFGGPAKTDRQIHYTDYRPVNGVLMPFGISEWVGANQTWSVQLNRIDLNKGLQDSDFTL